jgi:S1-C subfamily serine protease
MTGRLLWAVTLAVWLATAPAGAAETTGPHGVPNPAAQPRGMATLAPVLKRILPAVVSIEIDGHIAPEPGARRREPPREIHSVGSGVVYDVRQGLIVTNSHVIERADRITVTLTDGRQFDAKRIGADPDFDLAVIKIATPDLTGISFADSRALEVGDFVLAIGYPANIGQSVTSGIVSGLHRSNVGIEQFENFIQTDAAVYPGNSGGALVNLEGALVGINTAFIGATTSNPGMGFAIPANMARLIADQLIEFGDIRRGSLGISTDDPKPEVLRALKLTAPQSGAVVTKVDPGSPGGRAGLKPGDVVVRLGDRPVLGSSFLRNRMALLRVGEVAELEVSRDGKAMTFRVTVAAREARATKAK